MKDIIGKAILDYYLNHSPENIITATTISEQDVLPVSYLFRTYANMPKIEQHALSLAYGKVLDVGCGAGGHALYLQQQGLTVKGIDISEGAIHVCKKRGLTHAEVKHLRFETERYDTILLLMNGTGIFGTLNNTIDYLKHLKTLLRTNGQILIDSSDIKYMYQDDDGGFWHDTHANYYGELDYFLEYKGEKELPFTWLYLDFDTLNSLCKQVNLTCQVVKKGNHYDYLARITK